MTRHYYKGADGAVVCFDLTDTGSWEKVKFWVGEVRGAEPNCSIAIVGTKSDLLSSKPRGVSKETVQSYAAEIGARYYECSALANSSVAEPFVELVKEYSRKPKKNEVQKGEPVLRLETENVARPNKVCPCS
jgi:GTPase SAR1 family protein